MAENVEELGSVETPQTRDVARASSPGNFSVEDLRDGSNIFTLVMNQLHTIAESVNDLNQRLSALEQLQGRYGNVVADSVDAQSVKVGGVDVMIQGGDYAPKNHASSQTTYGQATTGNYGHAKLSNDTLNANSTGTAGVACSTGHKHSQYIEKSATGGLVKNDGTIDTTNYSTTDTKDTVGAGVTDNIVLDAGKTFNIPFVLQNSGTPKSYTTAKINNSNFNIMGVYYDYMYGIFYPVVNGKNVPVYDDSLNDSGKLLVLEDYQLKGISGGAGTSLNHVYVKSDGTLGVARNSCIFHSHTASVEIFTNNSYSGRKGLRIYNLEFNACNVVEFTIRPSDWYQDGYYNYPCYVQIDLPSMVEGASPFYVIEVHLTAEYTTHQHTEGSLFIHFNSEDPIYPIMFENVEQNVIEFPRFGGQRTSTSIIVAGHSYRLGRFR